MKNQVVLLLCAGLVACVSEHETLRNDHGQVVNCSNEGWGWLGAPVAMANQSDCVKKAEAAGFHKPGVADTASPPPEPVSTAQSGSLPPTVAPSPPAPQPPIPPAPQSANTVSNAPAANAPSPVTGSTADRIRRLDDLYKAGLITKDEYDRKRQEILSTL